MSINILRMVMQERRAALSNLFLHIPLEKANGGMDVKVICDERRDNNDIIKQIFYQLETNLREM